MNTKFKKIFLTGDTQIGKSTIIDRFICELNKNNIKYGGYKTLTVNKKGTYSIYIVPITKDSSFSEKNCIGEKSSKIFYPEIFDEYGVKLLEHECKNNDLLIFDEIGFIEDKSSIYKEKLLNILKNDKFTIVGVLRNIKTNLYKEIENIPSVNIIEINKENRDKIFIEDLLDIVT